MFWREKKRTGGGIRSFFWPIYVGIKSPVFERVSIPYFPSFSSMSHVWFFQSCDLAWGALNIWWGLVMLVFSPYIVRDDISIDVDGLLHTLSLLIFQATQQDIYDHSNLQCIHFPYSFLALFRKAWKTSYLEHGVSVFYSISMLSIKSGHGKQT